MLSTLKQLAPWKIKSTGANESTGVFVIDSGFFHVAIFFLKKANDFEKVTLDTNPAPKMLFSIYFPCFRRLV